MHRCRRSYGGGLERSPAVYGAGPGGEEGVLGVGQGVRVHERAAADPHAGDDWTIALLTNEEVLKVNQASEISPWKSSQFCSSSRRN